MFIVKPDADVTTPFLSSMQTPSLSSVMPGTVAMNAVAVDVLSHSPYGMLVVRKAVSSVSR